jgi:hypothetical protein
LKLLSKNPFIDELIDSMLERRIAIKKFRPDRLTDVADLLEGKGKFKDNGVEPSKFDMSIFFDSPDLPYVGYDDLGSLETSDSAASVVEKGCGFAACACGHAGLRPEFRRQGFKTVRRGEPGLGFTTYSETVTYKDKTDFNAAREFFGITEDDCNHLFLPMSSNRSNTPKAVAKRIRDFVAKRKVEVSALVKHDAKAKAATARMAARKAAKKTAKKVTVTSPKKAK